MAEEVTIGAPSPSRSHCGCAFVTGAGRGFGQSIAQRLSDDGISVAVLDIDGEAAARTADALTRRGTSAIGIQGDITNASDISEAVAIAESRYGWLDILVNNAGVASFVEIQELSREEWDRTLDINLNGLFVCCKAVVPGMVARGHGTIVNIASLAGKRGGGILGKVAYATAKAGVLGFTKAIARELAPQGIRVNAIAPAAFDTEMTEALTRDANMLQAVLATIPLGRLGRPSEVAEAAAFLASERSSYMTGETLNLDGGILME